MRHVDAKKLGAYPALQHSQNLIHIEKTPKSLRNIFILGTALNLNKTHCFKSTIEYLIWIIELLSIK